MNEPEDPCKFHFHPPIQELSILVFHPPSISRPGMGGMGRAEIVHGGWLRGSFRSFVVGRNGGGRLVCVSLTSLTSRSPSLLPERMYDPIDDVWSEAVDSLMTSSVCFRVYDPIDDVWSEAVDSLMTSSSVCFRMYYPIDDVWSKAVDSLMTSSSICFRMYDPIDDVWSEAVDGMMMPHEREKHNMIGVGTSKIFVLAGRGFDQDTFSEKDESDVANFNIGGHPGKMPGLKPLWDTDHPTMIYPHSNGGAVLLGRNIWTLGGLSFTKGTSIRMVTYYDIKRRRWRDAFPLPEGSFTNVDCVILGIPASNKDFSSVDRFLYDRWILW
ncbi:hypothetical protein ACOMHN_015310 [Nucella lapillus]